MFGAIAFLAIAFIYVPYELIKAACNGEFSQNNYKRRNDEIERHNKQVRYEDKMDNDYGFIVRKDK